MEVVLEEEEGEGNDEVLFGAVRKGTAEHLHAAQHDQQRAQAEKGIQGTSNIGAFVLKNS